MTGETFAQIIDGLDAWTAVPVLALTAFVETVFPPFPGDVLYISAGGFFCSTGFPPWLLWLPGFVGCALGTFLLEAAGRGAGPRWFERLVMSGSKGERGMARARSLLARHGVWALFFSRFIPGIRSLLVVAASWSGMGRTAVLVPSLLSAALWYALLSFPAVILGANMDAAAAFMADYGRLSLILTGALVVVLIVLRLTRGRGGK